MKPEKSREYPSRHFPFTGIIENMIFYLLKKLIYIFKVIFGRRFYINSSFLRRKQKFQHHFLLHFKE